MDNLVLYTYFSVTIPLFVFNLDFSSSFMGSIYYLCPLINRNKLYHYVQHQALQFQSCYQMI